MDQHATLHLDLDPERRSSPMARRFVVDQLRAWSCEHMADVAALCTSEIVGNAVRHAGTPMVVVIRRTERSVRVDVCDRSSSRPQVRHPGPMEEGGRGMLLVEAVADDWGVDELVDGKSVWFELLVQDGARLRT